MDQLLSKIDHLTYEIFAVFLPGAIATLSVLLMWFALGSFVPFITQGAVPELTRLQLAAYRTSIEAVVTPWGALGILVGISYFLGQALDHMYRVFNSKRPAPTIETLRTPIPSPPSPPPKYLWLQKQWDRWTALPLNWWLDVTFRVRRPASNFSSGVQPLWNTVVKKLAPDAGSTDIPWTALFPVARKLVWDQKGHSLITMYEVKYTFHRSIAMIGGCLFWVAFVSTVVATLFTEAGPHQSLLTTVGLVGAVLARRFAESYRVNWNLFGNAVVTESYAVLFQPEGKHESRAELGRD